MKVKTLLITVALTISYYNVSAQDLEYARNVVDTLSSDHMKGRGYVDKGEKKAADYIRNEFKKFGLKKFGKSYFQKFGISVNSFPGKVKLKVNDRELVPGEDFLIEPGSPSLSGIFETVHLTAGDLLSEDKLVSKLQHASGKFLVIENYDKSDFGKEEQQRVQDVINFLKYHPNNPAAGTVLLTNNKLTWSGSTSQNPKPALTITADSLYQRIASVELDIEAEFHEKHPSQNVVGYVEGTNSDSLIVFIAHYDHLGTMGENTYFPGANDNASGTAMLLNLAKYYSKNKPEFTTAFIAFGAEELGLLGSGHFVENPVFDLDKIKFLINFDISGTGDDGIQVVNGSVYRNKFDTLQAINQRKNLLPQVKIRGAACNSDHCFFHRQDVPLFYIYTLGGIQAYHDIYDRAETLPLTEFEDYFRLITAFVETL